MRLGLLLVALALLLPSGVAQSVGGLAPPPEDIGYAGGTVTVPLYGHIYDLLQPVPINTQPMIELDLARGFGTPGVSGAGPAQTTNFMRFYSSPGLVEYNVTDENGLPRYHPERGLSFDALLDTSQNLWGYWYMGAKAADAPQAGQTDGPEAGVLAALTVRMTVRLGDDIGADLDAGDIVAQGQTTLAPDQWLVNGAPREIQIDLGPPQMDRIPGNASFNVKVEWFNAESPDGETQVVQRDWVVHTGLSNPNRIELGVTNPLAMYTVRPTPVGLDKIAVRALMNSPWGNYDVDIASVRISIEGPSVPRSLSAPQVIQRSFEHNHHYEPVELTWTWPYQQDSAAAGDYMVTVTGSNLAGTASVTKTATFTIPESGRAIGYDEQGNVVQASAVDEANDTPAPPLSALLVVVMVAATLWRRRPSSE